MESAALEPTEHGRIDPDGTVYVRLPDGGEHQVGQWAAGDPAAGLAHYRRRYDELVFEVDLMRKRLKSGHARPEQAQGVISKVTEAIRTPNFVGDIPALQTKLDELGRSIDVRKEEISAAKKQARADAAERRIQIADEAERLAGSHQWKQTGQRLRDLLEEWKSLPRFDKGAEQVQWERFSAARSSFDKARRAHFAELDVTRAEAASRKQALVDRAQALSTSTDWAGTSRTYRELMDEWKAVPRASRDVDDQLWSEFRAAQDVFFAARTASDAERTAEEESNLAAKLELLATIETLPARSDHRAARAELSALMERWDKIGFVPRNEKPRLEKRLRVVEGALRNAERNHWRRTDPAARARAEATVESFSGALAKLEKQLAAATEAGDDATIARLTGNVESSRALLAAAESALAEYSME